MKTIRSLELACLASAGLVAFVGTALAQTPSGDATRGKALFYAHGCYACHGYNGQTGIHDLVGTGSPIVANVDLFITFLRQRADVAPAYPTTSMPNYAASTLPDQAARDIFAYIQTFKLDAPAVEDVPALEAILESAAKPPLQNSPQR